MNQKETIETLIYMLGKGVSLQVWDDGTVFARSEYDFNKTAKGKTVEEALKKLLKKFK